MIARQRQTLLRLQLKQGEVSWQTAAPANLQSKRARQLRWDGFNLGLWQKEINVRDFIQQNYEPYEGDQSFLAPATDRTKKIWKSLSDLFVEERKKGVLDVSQIPSSITAHGPGYIDRENEIIVGLQTEAPLKRAIMPNGGFRMVVNRSRHTDTNLIRKWSRRSPSIGRPTTKACSMPTRQRSGLPQFAYSHRTSRCLRSGSDHRRLPPGPTVWSFALDRTKTGRETQP